MSAEGRKGKMRTRRTSEINKLTHFLAVKKSERQVGKKCEQVRGNHQLEYTEKEQVSDNKRKSASK
jgi:hypothetical protein